jgi:hypothetical protein
VSGPRVDGNVRIPDPRVLSVLRELRHMSPPILTYLVDINLTKESSWCMLGWVMGAEHAAGDYSPGE